MSLKNAIAEKVVFVESTKEISPGTFSHNGVRTTPETAEKLKMLMGVLSSTSKIMDYKKMLRGDEYEYEKFKSLLEPIHIEYHKLLLSVWLPNPATDISTVYAKYESPFFDFTTTGGIKFEPGSILRVEEITSK